MPQKEIILEESFWKFLVLLEELKEPEELTSFSSSLSIPKEKIELYCKYLTQFRIEVQMDKKFIYPLKNPTKIKIEFTLLEWFAFQSAFAKNHKDDPVAYILQKKLEDMNGKKIATTLHEKINYNIMCRKIIKIKFHSHGECSLFPHRMVFLDGVLSLIGESVEDKSLVYFDINEISKLENVDTPYLPNLSQIEINDFVEQVRLINGKEERLVLKIYDHGDEEFLPEYHLLGNPFVTTSTEGDLIWAATIELCDDIFAWLYKMRDRVEVLDPGHVKEEFSEYCELKKIA